MKKKTVFYLLIFGCFTMAIILVLRRDNNCGSDVREPATESISTVVSVQQRTEHLASSPTQPTALTSISKSLAEELLLAKPGRLTTGQAHHLVRELANSPHYNEVCKDLLVSDSIHSHLLAVHVLLAASGMTDDLRDMALSDPSPHIRAEIINWLFRNKKFETLRDLIRESVFKVDSLGATDLLMHVALEPILEGRPVAVSRLDLGESLPQYLTLIAEYSPETVGAVTRVLNDTATSTRGKKLMLSTLASVRPDNYIDLLQQAFVSESGLAARIQIAQHIAACFSETDSAIQDLLASRMPAVLPGLEPVSLLFREQRLQQIQEYASNLEEACQKDSPDPMWLNANLSAYLDQGRIAGQETLAPELLRTVAVFMEQRNIAYDQNTVARALFIAEQIEKEATQ